MEKLLQKLRLMDNKGYKAYKSIQGEYQYQLFTLFIDYVQGDPFATPSKIRIVIPNTKITISKEWLRTSSRRIAVEDAFARMVAKVIHKQDVKVNGSGKSGLILFDGPSQEIMERSAVQITSSKITICLSVGLPANGRRINGKEAEKLFSQIIPNIIEHSAFAISDQQTLEAIHLADGQDAIREQMEENGWIAFIANGAILPRVSGVSDKPLRNAVPFKSPTENEVELSIPHQSEPIKGMAIKKGISLIVGGGYHGKSTLLKAIERGIYNHVRGDGREFVLTNKDAVKIRAEDGRKITGVNISLFINNLPHGKDTKHFTTDNASGSTSQAANVMEALEVGAKVLLIDEDTSATNFMIRDDRIQELVTKDKEPITPFIDRIKQLHDERNVSTILVMGGSGDYFSVADSVIMMDEYVPHNVTEKAKKIIEKSPVKREELEPFSFNNLPNRYFLQESLQTTKGKRSKTQAKGMHKILMGKTEISFSYTEQLIDPSQTRMIAEIIQYLDRNHGLKDKSLRELLEWMDKQINEKGLAFFTLRKEEHPGDIARPRKYEIAAVLNRMRTAKVISK